MSEKHEFDVVLHVSHGSVSVEANECVDEIQKTGLKCRTEVRELGPQAALEWLVPTAILLWIADKYVGELIKEKAKEDYKPLKQAIQGLYQKTFGSNAPIKRVLVRMDGSIIPDKIFTGNISYAYRAANGWTVKLLFLQETSANQYENACVEFASLIATCVADPGASLLYKEVKRTAEWKHAEYPHDIALSDMLERVRLLIYWNGAENRFFVVDAVRSSQQRELVHWPLGSIVSSSAEE